MLTEQLLQHVTTANEWIETKEFGNFAGWRRSLKVSPCQGDSYRVREDLIKNN